MSKMKIERGDRVWRDEKGYFHRENGPAIIERCGDQEWWVNGKRHRTDGPAVIFAKDFAEWWIKGIEISKEVEAWMIEMSINPDWKSWTDTERMWFKLRFCEN